MIARYTRPEMGHIWSDENKFRTWLEVEIAATETLAEAGIVPQAAAQAIREKGGFDLARINQIEAEVKHDVIAFTTAVAEKVGPESRWLHYGLTSNDVVDTAQALLVKQASGIIREDLKKLREVLKRRAWEFKDTPAIGRTHGIHAEPITFGLKLANWYSEMQRNLERFEMAAEQMRVGKLSGAVGNAAHLEPEYEEKICQRLGLNVAAVSSQVIQRDRHAFYVATLAVIASTLDKIATEIRHLQRTEVREAEEYFSEKQKGSSAMPHKRNPVTCEQISGLARVVRANAQAALENVALWHERDISHSSVERVILPDSTILLDHLQHSATKLVNGLVVNERRMLANLELTHGALFSQRLLLALVEGSTAPDGSGERGRAPMVRDDAYRIAQELAQRAWDEGTPLRELLAADERAAGLDLDSIFDYGHYTRYAHEIVGRLDEIA